MEAGKSKLTCLKTGELMGDKRVDRNDCPSLLIISAPFHASEQKIQTPLNTTETRALQHPHIHTLDNSTRREVCRYIQQPSCLPKWRSLTTAAMMLPLNTKSQLPNHKLMLEGGDAFVTHSSSWPTPRSTGRMVIRVGYV